MPILDDCVNSIFEPGNIGSGIGTLPPKIVRGTLTTPEDYDPAAVTYSLDYSKFYDSGYIGVN